MEGSVNIVKLLELFRDEEFPDLSETYIEDDHITTLSKEEIISKMKGFNVDALQVCRLGLINPEPENMCKLLHFAMRLNDKGENSSSKSAKTTDEGQGQPSQGPSSSKKPKKEVATLKTLDEKLQKLEKQLEEQKSKDELSEVERARRDVKEEATKGAKADMEVLHGKLLQLENVARKGDHKDKDRFTTVLTRFVAHKGKPSFAAALMLNLLSTKEEATIYEKEQKLIKRFGDDLQSSSIASHANMSQMPPSFSVPTQITQMAQNWPANQFGLPLSVPSTLPPILSGNYYLPPRVNPNIRGPRPRSMPQYGNRTICFRCRKPGHISRDCPSNQS